MGEAFYWLLSMSITATLVGTVVLVIRKLPFINKRAAAFIWIFPFLRLCIPASFGSRYSLMSLTSDFFERSVAVKIPVNSLPENLNILAMNHIALAQGYVPFTYKSILFERVFFVSSVIWLSVCIAGLAFILYSYLSTMILAGKAEHLYDNVYVTRDIASPILVGIIRPRILLPESMKNANTELILLHENAHASGLDNLRRLLALFISVIHWFNPFVWIFLKLFLCDMEYACDERVLSKIGEERRKEYALALVDGAESRAISSSAFGGAKISSRIKGILGYKRITVFSAVCLIIFVAALGTVLMTNAM